MARVRLDEQHRYIGTGVLRFLGDGLELTLDDLLFGVFGDVLYDAWRAQPLSSSG